MTSSYEAKVTIYNCRNGSLSIASRILLKMILESRLKATPSTALQAEVLHLACEISASTTAAPLIRALQAKDAAAIYAEAEDWRRAAEHYELAVTLLPLLAPDDDLREGIRVLQPGRAAAQGAACWLNAGDPERAAALAELGRAVFISRTTARRIELAALRAMRPDLADKFETLRNQLAKPDPTAATAAGLWEEVGPTIDRAETASEFEALLTTIRSLPGQERFLLPPKIKDLLAASAEGPVILLNASEYRCDALILTPHCVRPVPLRGVNLQEIFENATYIQMAGANAHNTQISAEERELLRRQTVKTLAWMWTNVVEPILKETEITSRETAGQWPRIWWVPGGPFAWLPIHAAGRHGEQETEDSPTLLDRAQSSYVPSVSMLARARARARQAAEPGKVLIVAMPKTPGQSDLPAAIAESRAIARRFPATILGTISGAQSAATREAIISALSAHPMAHFACHAYGDWVNSWRSFLAIQSDQSQSAEEAGALYLSDVASLDLRGRRFACLSACAIARTTDLRLLDEALHLTSGFLLAGFTHVSGTLWEVNDYVAAEFAEEMYSRLEADTSKVDNSRVAHAVHEATRVLRERYIDNPTMWASHVYSGP